MPVHVLFLQQNNLNPSQHLNHDKNRLKCESYRPALFLMWDLLHDLTALIILLVVIDYP